jgi:hypothetical protein
VQDALHVYALVQGLEEEQDRPTSQKSARSAHAKSAGDSLELLRGNLSDNHSNHSASEVSMDEDEEAQANAHILRTLNVLDDRDSQHMAPFPPCVHKTHTLEDLESDLFRTFRRKDKERGIRTSLRSRPVSASSGSEGSRPSTAGTNSSEISHLLAMLRGEFHVRLTIVEGRDLRGRPRNVAPSACADVTWLPAAHGAEPLEVNERTRIVRSSVMPAWNTTYNFDVDPDGPEGWSLLTFIVRYFNPPCLARSCFA